jgi:hypothetical protein
MSKKRKAIFCMALAAILWSAGGVLIKLIDWQPMSIAGGRSIIAAAIIWFAFRKEQLSFSKSQWAGAVAYCSCVSLFVIATKLMARMFRSLYSSTVSFNLLANHSRLRLIVFTAYSLMFFFYNCFCFLNNGSQFIMASVNLSFIFSNNLYSSHFLLLYNKYCYLFPKNNFMSKGILAERKNK